MEGGVHGRAMTFAGHHLSSHLSSHLSHHFMMWRPCIDRSRRSGSLSTGPIWSRLASLLPLSPAGTNMLIARRAARMGRLSRRSGPGPGCLDEMRGATPMAGGLLLMAHPPVDPTLPSRANRPGRLATNTSAPVEPAERRQSIHASAANHVRLGVRRPIKAPMPADRREQAITALAHLLIAHLERQLPQPDPDAPRSR